jgi:hypothetical protein
MNYLKLKSARPSMPPCGAQDEGARLEARTALLRCLFRRVGQLPDSRFRGGGEMWLVISGSCSVRQ